MKSMSKRLLRVLSAFLLLTTLASSAAIRLAFSAAAAATLRSTAACALPRRAPAAELTFFTPSGPLTPGPRGSVCAWRSFVQ